MHVECQFDHLNPVIKHHPESIPAAMVASDASESV